MFSLSVRPASSSEAARPPPFKILNRRGSYLSLARLPFTVRPSLPCPGLSLVIYIGGRAVMELWIPPQTSLQMMWFLRGSTWFQQRQIAGTCFFRLDQTLRNNVVPMWFHVVPTMMTCIPPQTSLQIMWFLCGSAWFQQCRSARLAATNETLLGWLWTLAGCWQHPNKSSTSNVLPSTITSPPAM